VAPNTNVIYHGNVIYTILLANEGAMDVAGVLFTDTLPVSVTFTSWIDQPGGATMVNDRITWNGRPATLNFLMDVTERRKMEQALKDSEEMFRNPVEHSPVGVFLVQDGAVRYANPRLAEMTISASLFLCLR
jgi:uncharacterized repeat protein (TIGR01451 family)